MTDGLRFCHLVLLLFFVGIFSERSDANGTHDDMWWIGQGFNVTCTTLNDCVSWLVANHNSRPYHCGEVNLVSASAILLDYDIVMWEKEGCDGLSVNMEAHFHSEDLICEVPPESGNFEQCSDCEPINAGKRELLDWQPGSSIPSQGLCDTATNCNAVAVDQPFCHSDTISGAEVCTLEVEHTPNACTLPDSADLDANADGAKCTNIDGTLLCKDPQDPNKGQNCGYVNDEYICLGAIPDGNCLFLSDGGMACAADADSPPAPDDGVTAGVSAPADLRLSDQGSLTNIYRNSTVNRSAGSPSGSDGSTGAGGQELEPESVGSASVGGSCDVQPTCTGEPIQCAILQQQWLTGCQDVGTESDILADTGLSGLEDPETGLGSDSFDFGSSLDDSGWLGTRTCDIDIPLDVGFLGAVTIPLSSWCGLIGFIGLLLQVSAGLISLRIVAGGF